MSRRNSLRPSRGDRVRGQKRSGRSSGRQRKLSLEPLEARHLLALFTVTDLNDAAVIAAGDAPGTLRQAIFDANAALGADDIAFQAGLTGTILLTKGELAITEALTITGPGAAMLTVDASGNDPTPLVDDGLGSRIFNINDGVAGDSPVTISGLTVTGGDANSSGGGIRSLESLTLLDSVVSGNATTDDGAGVFVSTSAGTATITRSTISGNVAPTSGDFGGGLYAYTNSGSITIRDSTIANNLAFYGGGIWARTVAATGNTTITGSTISGNDANQSGGGIYVQTGAGTTTIAHSTISDNTANADLGVIGHGGGLYASETGTLNILHTIIAGNVDANAVTRAPDLDLTHAATVPTLDIAFSLIGNNSGSGLAAGMPDANGNLIGTAIAPIDPLLGPLANNGGPTQTHALLAGSPAIDTGNPAIVLPPTKDQRGTPFLRIVDGDGAAGARIDLGAYERQTVAALGLVVDTLVDENDGNYAPGDLSLREAVGLANGSIGADTITFAAAISGGTITLSLGEIGISEAVTIDSSSLAIGIKIDAAGNDPTPLLNNGDGSRIFNIDDGNSGTDNPVTLVDLTLTGGDVSGDGGAVRTLEGLSVIDSVIRNSSAFGDANDGGGIFAGSPSGTVNILRSTIADNLAGQSGGGLAFETNSGDLAITDSTMSGNDTVAYGGGIFAGASTGTISITSSTFSNNATLGPSASGGGGLFAQTESGTTTVINSTFSGNTSEDSGGGIYAISNTGTTTITHTTITGGSTNSAGGFGSGGGLYMAGAGGLVLKHTIIAGNSDNTNIAPDLDLSSKFTGSANVMFNLIGINTGSGLAAGMPAANGNLIGTAIAPIDPLLGPLANNGGPTQTHALLVGSVAIDAGDPTAVAGAGGIPDFDQRGGSFPRVLDGDGLAGPRIDIGAVEFPGVILPKPNVFFGVAGVATDGLHPTSDTGVPSQPMTIVDRITSDTTPTFWGTAKADATVRVFVRNAAGNRVLLGATVATLFDITDPLATGRWSLTSMIDMNDPLLGFAALDGVRQFEVEAEDIAGSIGLGAAFELATAPQPIVDNTTNEYTINVSGLANVITDLNIGLDISHTFDADLEVFLISPTGTIVQLFADVGGSGNNFIHTTLDDEAAISIAAGLAPFTGSYRPMELLSVFDAENPNGTWTLRIIDDNPADSGTLDRWSLCFQSSLEVFFDTQGPRVDGIHVGDFDLTAPKPGPTPRIDDLTIKFNDLPMRDADFLYPAVNEILAETPGNYYVVGDRVGIVPIVSATFADTTVAGTPGMSTVKLVFANSLADDHYTLTVRDNLRDNAGNRLDGEWPGAPTSLPSGDDVPGGDFVFQFTVDAFPELGVWAAGTVLIDANGNLVMEPTIGSNGDLAFHLGFSSDYVFAGNFAASGTKADGFDKLAAYGRVGNQFRWMVDFTNDGVPDLIVNDPANINGIPVAGNFDGNKANGDEVGIFTGTAWHLDTNHDFRVDSMYSTSYRGFPIAGDFDGDGDDDLGTYIASQSGGNQFSIDLNAPAPGGRLHVDGVANQSFRVGLFGGFYGFPGVRERPVAADMNRDGVDDIGLWVPDGTALVPGDKGEWFFLVSDNDLTTPAVENTVLNRITGGFASFTPIPFGNDIYAQYGNSFALPVVGNFDPPGPPAARAASPTTAGGRVVNTLASVASAFTSAAPVQAATRSVIAPAAIDTKELATAAAAVANPSTVVTGSTGIVSGSVSGNAALAKGTSEPAKPALAATPAVTKGRASLVPSIQASKSPSPVATAKTLQAPAPSTARPSIVTASALMPVTPAIPIDTKELGGPLAVTGKLKTNEQASPPVVVTTQSEPANAVALVAEPSKKLVATKSESAISDAAKAMPISANASVVSSPAKPHFLPTPKPSGSSANNSQTSKDAVPKPTNEPADVKAAPAALVDTKLSALPAAKAIVSSAPAQVVAAIAGADPKPLQMTTTVVELPQVVVPVMKTVVPSKVSGVTAAAPSVKAGNHPAAQFSGLRLANPDRDSLATARTAEATRVVSRSPIRPTAADAAMADLFATRERSLADDIGDDFSSDVHHEAKWSQATADLALELALAEFTSGIQ